MPALDRASAAGLAALLVLATMASGLAQEPRFRGGTNLVRLDVYVSADGMPVTDLEAKDFEVREDNAPQAITSFEFVPARGVVPDDDRRESNTVAESVARVAQPDARAFVLFLDTLHVQVEGSYRAANPVATMLDRVIGADDLVGVMTPEMSPRNMTLSPRSAPIGEMLRTSWAWGQRGTTMPADPREDDLRSCYADVGPGAGIAKELIERRRERQTLRALGDLVEHLEALREERTFVLVVTEGWTLPRADERLARTLDGTSPGGPDPIGVRDGTLARAATDTTMIRWCERERSLVALSDLGMEFQQLAQRANRANVAFYPIDPRGLVVFDDPSGPLRPATPGADRGRLQDRHNGLLRLAEETDGTAVVDISPEKALPRLLTDIGSYYLLGYVSSNTKLDGRYRRLQVQVSRPGVRVRARPGYLAPSASDVNMSQAPAGGSASGGTARGGVAGGPGGAGAGGAGTANVSEALSRLPVGRRPAAVHLMAAGAPGRLAVHVELDRTTAALPDWAKGGRLSLAVEPADRSGGGSRLHATRTLAAGVRVQVVHLPEDETPLVAGRYQVRAELLAEGARTPIVVSSIVDVPAASAWWGTSPLAARRGPGTGRVFEPTADARFRRTERLQAEVTKVNPALVVTARLLNRSGQTMNIPVALTERPGTDDAPPAVITDLPLAPLAAGEYVLEFTATKDGRTETRSFAIRIVT